MDDPPEDFNVKTMKYENIFEKKNLNIITIPPNLPKKPPTNNNNSYAKNNKNKTYNELNKKKLEVVMKNDDLTVDYIEQKKAISSQDIKKKLKLLMGLNEKQKTESSHKKQENKPEQEEEDNLDKVSKTKKKKDSKKRSRILMKTLKSSF